MTEFRVMCDHVKVDKKGRSWIEQARRPIGRTGQTLTTVFKDKAEAEKCLEKWEQSGKAYEENRIEMAQRFPDLYTTIIHQTNYRVQSREVTDWE